MTRDVISVRPRTPLKEIIEALLRSHVSGVPVVDGTGHLVGLVTEADLVAAEAYPDCHRTALDMLAGVVDRQSHRWAVKAAGITAADVMTRRPLACAPDDDVHVVARQLVGHGIKRLPVLEDGRLVGIVARQDILQVLARPDGAISADVGRLLQEQSDSLWEDHSVGFTVSEGIVTLTGEVRFEADRRVVAAMVQQVPGVIRVRNELRWRESRPIPPAQAAADAAHDDSVKRWTLDSR